jgi:hypothetical protein
MALTIFLFKVSNLEISNTRSDLTNENQDPSAQLITDDNTTLLTVKVVFRGIYFQVYSSKQEKQKSVNLE